MHSLNQTKPQFFIPELDGLRFIAFLLIFIHHNTFTGIFFIDSIKSIGWIGVDIFFCLSAFLLTRLLSIELREAGSISVLNFFIRRILRIWPLYFTYVIIAIVFSWYEGVITAENWFRIAGLVTFSDNVFAAQYGYNPIRFTGHLWTISYEEQFYLVIPFIVLYLAKKTSVKIHLFLGGCMFAGCMIRLLFIIANAKHPAIWVLPVTHFESVIVGVWLGFGRIKTETINPRFYLVAAIVSISAIVMLPGDNIISYHLMLLYPCVGVAAGALLSFVLYTKIKPIKNFICNKVFVFLGRISFGLYVFHNFSITLTAYFVKEAYATLFTITISLAFTIVFASLSYLFLEFPFLLLKRKFTLIFSRPV